jgi:hypothetical protein
MMLVVRHVVAAVAAVGLFMAWWLPAPVLIRLESVDWHKRFEAQKSRGLVYPGASLGSRSRSLAEFVAAETAGRVTDAKDPAWIGVFRDVEARGADYREPSTALLSSLPGQYGYVELQEGKGSRYLEYRRIIAEDFRWYSIPAHLKYPLRKYWPFFLAAAAVVLAVFALPLGSSDIVETSSAAKGFRWCAVAAAVFAGMITWPFVYGTGGGGAYASILVGGVFFFGALVGMGLFGRQIVLLRQMAAGDYLAHFTYETDEWLRFVQWNFGQESAQKKALWVLIFSVCLGVGLGFLIVQQDAASVAVFAVLMGLMGVLWLLAVGLPRRTRHRGLRGPKEAYVGRHGVYLNGTVHSWGMLGSRLESVTMQGSPLPHILLVYSVLMMSGRVLYFFRHPVSVRIPVPRGQDGSDVVRALRKEARAAT